jgi:hypothetical protein
MAIHDAAKDEDLDAKYREQMVEFVRDEQRHAALGLLESWISSDPLNRCIERIARIHDRWLIEIRGRFGVYSSQTQETLDSAVRTVLMSAIWEGDR